MKAIANNKKRVSKRPGRNYPKAVKAAKYGLMIYGVIFVAAVVMLVAGYGVPGLAFQS